MKSPPYSPDLNPIEWVWSELKSFVRSKFCESESDVLNAIREFQEALTPHKCQNYILKLREVIQKVIRNGGGPSNM